jgi:hypothetical protein
MNLKRLSTNSDRNSNAKQGNALQASKQALQAKITKLLSSPSNLERKEDGRLFIISENRYLNEGAKQVQLISMDNGEVLKTFNSRADCGRFLEVSSTTIAN